MKRVLETWHKLDEWIQAVERALIVLGLSVILIMGMLNVILRWLNISEIIYTGFLLKQLTLWLGLLGATVATVSTEHLNVDAFSRMLKQRGLHLNKLVIGLFCITFSAIFTYYAFKFFSFQGKQIQSENVGGGKYAWLWITIFPASFTLMTLRYLFQTIEYSGVFFSSEVSETPAEQTPDAAPSDDATITSEDATATIDTQAASPAKETDISEEAIDAKTADEGTSSKGGEA